MDLKDVAKLLRDIDFVMLMTHTEGGEIAGRPMSNNREVDYDGDSWFFADGASRVATDAARNEAVTIAAQGAKGLLGKPPVFLSIEGNAAVVRDAAEIERRWTPELKRWWPDGPTSPGLVLIKVSAERIHFWDGEEEGEVPVR